MKSDVLTAHQQELPFELASLASAVNYQRWVYRTVEPFIGKRVLEIGAGIGNMSLWLPLRERLILTETDPELKKHLEAAVARKHGDDPRISIGQLDLSACPLEPYIAENLDTIVSFNVLEHIPDDRACVASLSEILRKSAAAGPRRLVTFVPAHRWAYGEMDRSFQHFRRYSKAAVRKLHREIAPDAKLKLKHFNLFGLAGWVLNGRILRKASIDNGSIRTFEMLCPWLAPVDDLLHRALRFPMGQSLLFVFEWDGDSRRTSV